MAFRKLIVYQKAFAQAMHVFEVSKQFPKEERYSLTDQIRRSSRSVCANLAESYRKRMYPAHFVSKVTDAEMENSETVVWLDFALSCTYLSESEYNKLMAVNAEVGKLLHHMRVNPTRYS